MQKLSFYLVPNRISVVADMVNNGYISDGTLGLSQFYQARGYTVGTCFSQFTDNLDLKYGFTFEKYKEQIDNGHPVMIHLKGHTVIGIGYNPVTPGWRNRWRELLLYPEGRF